MPDRTDSRGAGSLGPLAPLVFALALFLVLVALTATASYLTFVPIEGATGVMRIHWPWWRNALVAAGQWAVLVPFALAVFRITANAPLERSRWVRTPPAPRVGNPRPCTAPPSARPGSLPAHQRPSLQLG